MSAVRFLKGRRPHFPSRRCARELEQPIAWPVQYLRAAPKGAQPRVSVDLKSFESCFEEQHGVPERRGGARSKEQRSEASSSKRPTRLRRRLRRGRRSRVAP